MIEMDKGRKVCFVALCVMVFLCSFLFSSALLSDSRKVPSSGIIKSLGIDVSVSFIDWGLIGLGQTVTRSIVVTNTNNTILQLGIYTENWIPVDAENCFEFSWEGTDVLGVGESSTLQLSIKLLDGDISFTDFGFSIVVSAQEY